MQRILKYTLCITMPYLEHLGKNVHLPRAPGQHGSPPEHSEGWCLPERIRAMAAGEGGIGWEFKKVAGHVQTGQVTPVRYSCTGKDLMTLGGKKDE